MLRIACSCGNILKVSDDKAGKKIRCPECDELVLAKKSSAVSSKPLPVSSGDAEVDDSRDFEDIDDVDEAPAKKKGGAGMLLAILGVLFVLFMVLVLGALV